MGSMCCGRSLRTEIVVYRSSLLFLLFLSVVLSAVLLTGVLPYKYEVLDDITLRIGLWNLCAWFEDKPFQKCFGNYNDLEEEHDWFNALRYLLPVAFAFILMSHAYGVCTILRAKKSQVKSYNLPAVLQLLAGLILLTVQILYHTFHLFEFIEDVRWYGLSWTEESEIEEIHGEGYYMTWAIIVLTLVNVVFCFIAGKKDADFSHSTSRQGAILMATFYTFTPDDYFYLLQIGTTYFHKEILKDVPNKLVLRKERKCMPQKPTTAEGSCVNWKHGKKDS